MATPHNEILAKFVEEPGLKADAYQLAKALDLSVMQVGNVLAKLEGRGLIASEDPAGSVNDLARQFRWTGPRQASTASADAVEQWRKAWPAHCKGCGGWGGRTSPINHPDGSTTATEPYFAVCESTSLIEQCHRCGAPGLDAEGEGPCSFCGWNFDDGIPEHDSEPAADPVTYVLKPGDVGECLIRARKQSDFSQTELAKKVKLSQSRLSFLELHPEALSLDQLLHLFDELGLQLCIKNRAGAR